MPRMPKRVKFRKQMRGTLQPKAGRGNYVAFGEYGLQALEPHWISARQIEAGRVAAQLVYERAPSCLKSRACLRKWQELQWLVSHVRCRSAADSLARGCRSDVEMI
jgi:hypothetical protein